MDLVHKRVTRYALVAGSVVMTSCLLPQDPGTAPTITFEFLADTIVVALNQRLDPAIGASSDGAALADARIQLESATPAVVEIDSVGNLFGVRRGEAEITATFISGATGADPPDTTFVATVVVASLQFPTTSDTIFAINDTVTVRAGARDVAGEALSANDSLSALPSYELISDTNAIEWRSAPPRIIARQVGADTIRARLDTASVDLEIVVVQRADSLDIPTIPSFRSLTEARMLEVVAWDARRTTISDPVVMWTSRDPAIVDVSGSTATSAGNGVTWLIVDVDGLVDSTQVTVSQVARNMTIVSGDAQGGTVGATLAEPLTVQLVDSLGNDAAAPGIAVDFVVTTGGGTFGGADSVRAVSDDAGITTTAVGLTLGTVAGTSNTITIKSPALPTPPVVLTIEAVADAPQSIGLVSGDGQVGGIGTPLSLPFVVTVRDQFGNGIAGHPVVFAVTEGGGTIGGESSTTIATDADGFASVLLTLGTVTGAANVVTASASGLAGSPVLFTATGQEPVATVQLTPLDATVFVGETEPYAVTLRDGAGNLLTGRSVSWGVIDSTVASIAGDGMLTGVMAGATRVVALVETKADTVPVTVIEHVAKVTVTPPEATVAASTTIQLFAGLEDRFGSPLNRPVTWTSRDESLATVTSAGVVTGVAAGQVYVVATAEGVSDSSLVTVLGAVASIEIVPDTVVLDIGDDIQLTATLRDAADNVLPSPLPVWTTADPGVATVSGSGLVTAVQPGETVVQASGGGVTADVAVFVVSTTGQAAVSVGEDQTACAIADNGSLYCWGLNNNHEAGTSDDTLRTVPQLVPGGRSYTSVAVGSDHVCAVAEGGQTYCWGWNGDGRLGTGDWERRTTPDVVTGGHTFTSVVTGSFHSCAIDTSDEAWCWGANVAGKLGDGTTTFSNTPVRVDGALRFRILAAGRDHTCGVTTSGDAYCWGNNTSGQLGEPSVSQTSQPVLVSGSLRFRTIAAMGDRTCGVAISGEAYCWGENGQGEVGDGAGGNRRSPSLVSGDLVWRSIAVAWDHTCGITINNSPYCWGAGWGAALGTGAENWRSTPFPVLGNLSLTSMSIGQRASCGITLVGSAYCWGQNQWGTVGNGNPTGTLPSVISGGPYGSIGGGWARGQTCAVTTGNAAVCWGSFSIAGAFTPTPIGGGLAFATVATGDRHACGLNAPDGAAYCWGSNDVGQLGDNSLSFRPEPSPVDNGLAYVQITAGPDHSCGIAATNVTYCWGGNGEGQLGNSSRTSRIVPVEVAGNHDFSQIDAGYLFTCGLEGQTAFCWGNNNAGQLGNGSTEDGLLPDPVDGALAFTQVSAGSDHACGVTVDNDAFCWGSNGWSKLGDPTLNQNFVTVPNRVGGNIEWTKLSAGANHTCGIDTSRQVYCWGASYAGQTGWGSTRNTNQPERTLLGVSAVDIEVFDQHTCARTEAGQLLCWGDNWGGQIGIGVKQTVEAPEPVAGGITFRTTGQ